MIGGSHILRGAAMLALLSSLLIPGGCAPEPRSQQESFIPGGVRFSERDREIIRRFYGNYEFPPELNAPDVLTPSPEKRIEISSVLPPGPSGIPLPVELENRLTSLPPGYVRFRSGDDVVLMDSRTREVLDVVHGVFP